MTGYELRRARLRAGLNQTELGELIGLWQGQVSALETGRERISPEMNARLRDLFGTLLDDVTERGIKPPTVEEIDSIRAFIDRRVDEEQMTGLRRAVWLDMRRRLKTP